MWAFGVLEDDLEHLYWSVSRYSLVKKIQLVFGEKYACALSTYTSFNQVARNALGTSSSPAPAPRPKIAEPSHEGELDNWVARVNQSLRY